MEAKKKNISLRLSQNDIERVSLVAQRLDVKESDLLRFAIKQMLDKLAPFQDAAYAGTDLLPVLMEVGEELSGFFEFSGEQLEEIVNAGVKDEGRLIECADLKLLAMASVNQEYVRLKLNNLADSEDREGNGLKEYLKSKYLRAFSRPSQDAKADWPPFLTAAQRHKIVPRSA